MKAVLTFFIGKEKLFLEKGELCELDDMCIREFKDSSDIRHSDKYKHLIDDYLEQFPERKFLRQQNGSIGLLLLDDDENVILDRDENGNEYEHRVKIIYGKNGDSSIKGVLYDHYLLHPYDLQELLKRLYLKLKDEYPRRDWHSVKFMNYDKFSAIQDEMFGDNKSLFSYKDVNIKNRQSYSDGLQLFLDSIDFNQLPQIYLSCRRTAILALQEKKNTDSDLEDSEFEAARDLIFGYNGSDLTFQQQSTISSYLELQKEAMALKETDELNDKKHEKKRIKK